MRILTMISLLTIICSTAAAQTGLFTYDGGYFIRNGSHWEEYRPDDKQGIWASYTQYDEETNFYNISNSSCSVSVPKSAVNKFYIVKNGNWEPIYDTKVIYGYFNDTGRDLYCFENGYFVRDGDEWRLYLPEKKAGLWCTFTTYDSDDNYLYIYNSDDKMAVPVDLRNRFHLGADGGWKATYTPMAIYDSGYSYYADSCYADSCQVSANSETKSYASTGKDYYDKEDYANAVPYLRKASDMGDPESTYLLSTCYTFGYGVDQNLETARSLTKKAAERGYAQAQYTLGIMYQEMEDTDTAIYWTRKAAEQNLDAAIQELISLYYSDKEEKEYGDIFKYCLKEAENDNDEAMYILYKCYENGYGVKKDLKEAEKWKNKFEATGDTILDLFDWLFG